MSSDSEVEFYDACDTTPVAPKSTSNQKKPPEIERVSLNWDELRSFHKDKSTVQEPSNSIKSGTGLHIKLPVKKKGKNIAHSVQSTSLSPLSNKLASSLPTLHLQDAPTQNQTKSTAQSLLKSLDITFSKEDLSTRLLNATPNPDNNSVMLSKPETEDNRSAWSGSMLSNLINDEGDEDFSVPARRKRKPIKEESVVTKHNEEEIKPIVPSSPGESRSSSVDVFFQISQTSAPFRVVELDNASIYSTTVVQDKLVKSSTPEFEVKKYPEELESTPGSEPEASNIIHIELPKPDEVSIAAILPLSPEPDIIASTKSNSLPRTEQPKLFEYPNQINIEEALAEAVSPAEEVLTQALEITPREDINIRSIDKPIGADCERVNESSTRSDEKEMSGTKTVSSNVDDQMKAPIAPPRKRKGSRKGKDEDGQSMSSIYSLPPTKIVLRKEIDTVSHSLDLNSAIKGEFYVKHQDTEISRASGPRDNVEMSIIGTAGDTSSQASTPEKSRKVTRRRSRGSRGSRSDMGLSSDPKIDENDDFMEAASSVKKKNSLKEKLVKQSSLGSASSKSVPCSDQRDDSARVEAMVRLQTNSGKDLTDSEILSQVTVLNLDTGERIPLSEAEDSLPGALNPLSLHIMRITSEYSQSGMDLNQDSDEESIADVSVRKFPEIDKITVKKKTAKLKRFIGRKVGSAMNRAKTLAQEVSTKGSDEKDVFEDDTPAQNTMQYVKIKTAHSHKGPHEFDNLMYVQELKGEHRGPIWCMKFSLCGRLLATAGQDHVLRVWVVKQAFHYFLDIRTKWNADVKTSPTPSQESLVSQHSSNSSEGIGNLDPNDDGYAPFMPKPFCVYTGHTADVLDISWSKNYFMLTSSMDKTVRLWHISRKECLCIFKHVDFVTAIAFHPRDDRYFISGSLDGKLRLWSIPDKQVVLWNEVEGHPKLITAANFCHNGTFTVVGTYNGRCLFYKTEELKYYTQIHVRSSRGRNAKGRKITGIEPLKDEEKLLITSNDSRLRLYDLSVLNVSCKYKGHSNVSSQIRAGFSHDGKYIVAGSENQCIYLWKTHHDYSKFSSARKDRNTYWEGVKAHSAVVTCAIFSPHPEHVFSFIEQQERQKKSSSEESSRQESKDANGAASSITTKGYVLVSADFNGCIKVFLKKEKPKHSSLPASALV